MIGRSPSFLAKSGETLFPINSVPAPYFPPSTSFANHRAWLSAEILHPESETPENYRIVGRVLAELIGPDCVALYHPESKRVVPANLERTTELLRSEDPIAATFR